MTIEEIMAAGHCRAADLDVIGNIFGMKFHPGGSKGLVSLFIEDDGLWHLRATFDVSFLNDLHRVAKEAKRR